MSNLVYVLLVLLLSLHACTARHLSFSTDKRIGTKSDRIDAKLHSSSINSKPNKVQADDLANTMKGDDSNVSPKKDESKGGEAIISYSREATQTEEPRRQARSTGPSASETKEKVNSKENDIVEDVVAMDYAQPHRKPPIHNRKL